MRSSEPVRQSRESAVYRSEKNLGHAHGRRAPERIAIEASILDSDEPLHTRDAKTNDAPLGHQVRNPRRSLVRWLDTKRDFIGREITYATEQVMQAVGVPCPKLGGSALKLFFQLCDHLGIEEFAEFLTAQQFCQQPTIQRKGLRFALGQG